MSSTLELIQGLELATEDDTFEVDDFVEVGSPTLVAEPSYKDAPTEWETIFTAEFEGEEITATVSYTSGMDGLIVQHVAVDNIPKGYDVEAEPEFEFQECEDEDFE